MATAGDRYEERTGNIWSYAHRGDMTGLRAAISRGVSVDMANTVGWTPCHAAAAGGQTRALKLLVKSGADLTVADKGGTLPAHQAAQNGHLHTLLALQELGADITKVRLSQAKGKDVREALISAYRRGTSHDDEEDDSALAVGYSRKQQKSTAFWGPRRTPISTKIKKKIIKEKRKKKKMKHDKLTVHEEQNALAKGHDRNSTSNVVDTEQVPKIDQRCNDMSYVETVRQIKRNKKNLRLQKQGRKRECEEKACIIEQNSGVGSDTSSNLEDDIMSVGDESEPDEYRGAGALNSFSALSLLESNSDDE